MTSRPPFLSRRDTLKLLGAAPVAAAAVTAGPRTRGVAAQDTTEVRLTSAPSSPAEQRVLEGLLQEFMAANPSISVAYEPVTAEYDTKLQTDLAAGTAADIFAYDSLPAPDLMQAGVLEPMGERLSEAQVDTADFFPGLIEAFTYEDELYGVPKDFSTLGMVYDPAAFEAANVTAVPTTWDELRAAAEAITEAQGSPAIVYGPNFDRYIAFLYQAGGAVINEDRSEIVLNSPEALTALQYYHGLYTDGLAATYTDVGAQWPGDAFSKDQAAIVFEGPWLIGFMAENAPDKAYEIAELPAGPAGKATMAFTVAYGINANSEVKDEAFQVISYLTGVEGMTKWSTGFGVLPSRPAVADAYLAEFPRRVGFLNGGEYARPWQLGPGGTRFSANANAELQGLFAGQLTPEQALENMQSRAEQDIRLD
ncbi:MAG: N-Acetyl-D-glucosamine ABC transport system, sugar-binding protein [uncultured Thermomicrobiales bacterium]|uniref:N-Acetyl-D-glucosamine ABC transport system, sugar-binding protein n=1 Tax=uncultured Thermomicrobiales bacterium TaxID=1645740 RepID=A0A6J4UAT4_9BACT|nr:MAG: N-Acetyl-D-glucosamine ABC transport system, sugar-binding protein [uncultured Thermomicrobiales bacterium]